MVNGKLSSQYFWGGVIGIIVIAIFMMFRNTSENKLIPEHIIKQIAYESLNKKKGKIGEIPFDSRIRVTLVGEAIYEQDLLSGTSGIIKRDVGFEIIQKGYVKTGVIGIHPYNGQVMGIRWERMGYGGKSSASTRTIVPVSVIDQKENR